MDLLIAHSFFPQTILPSRVTKNTFSLVDHIFLFQQHHSAKIEAGNLITDISDHFASILILKENTSSAKTASKVRCFSEKNRARFQEKIQKINWNDVLKCKDANRCTVIFNNNLTQCFNDCFPLRTLPQKRLKDKPWVNKGLRKCIQKKNRLYKHSVKFKDEGSISKYKKYKNILTACLRQAEINYFHDILKDNANAIFRMWSIMGPMLNPKKSKQTIRIAKLIGKSKRTWTSDAHIASLLNNFFCNIGRKINSMVDPTRTPLTEYLRNPNEHSFFLSKVTVEEVLNELNRLKPGKAAGYDNIRPDLIKDCYESLVTPQTYIYNVSFVTGVFPDIWKIAKVIPVFKKGDRSNVDNYRLISLLSCFEKILERLMCKRMLAFLKKHSILYKLQFGFRENHSTVMALIEALNKIYKNLDEGKFVLGVFLDLKKTFDTIDHKILLKKLEHYGIRGIVNKWFSSYLLNRKQFTAVNGESSTLSSINTGIPQGSVLGPLLFTICVNDIANSTNLQPRLFADDTNIFAANENITHLIQNTNTELEKIDTWFKANRLKLSVDKTTYCIYSPKKKLLLNTPEVRIGDVIQKSDSVRYLGLIIDEKLTWEKHIDELGNKINRYASIFRKIRDLLPKKMSALFI